MKTAITPKTTREELCAIIVAALETEKITAVLVGGSVVSIYTDNEYESQDLDFISASDHGKIAKVMATLGFQRRGKDFVHSRTEFTVEFPLGPLAIGNLEPVKAEGKLQVKGVEIKLLSPTQSVMDRLSWFYFNNDRQCLDQAVAICLRQQVNLERVKIWSREEGEDSKFELFLKYLADKSKRKRT